MLVIAPTTFTCGFLIILPFFLRNKTVTTSSGQTSLFAAMQLYAGGVPTRPNGERSRAP